MTNKVNETAAADTLKPSEGGSSKAAMMARALAAMQGMKIEDLSHFLHDSLAQVGQEAEHIPDGNASKNKASVAMKEDIDEVFGETLSEDLKTKATTLFEAHVAQRVAIEMAHLTEQMQTVMNEQVDIKLEELNENFGKYVNYAADKWMEENALAVEQGIRTEIAEEFISNLRNLFVESYIDIPENRVDAFDALAAKVVALEDKLNTVTDQNIELQNALAEKEKDAVLEGFKDGLTSIQSEKLVKLAEGISFGSVDELKKKLATLKESVLGTKPVSTGIVKEESDPLETEKGKDVVVEEKKPVNTRTSFIEAMKKQNGLRV